AILGDPNNNNRPSTNMISSGRYLKLRQVSVGYSLSDKITQKIGFKAVRFYVSGTNLLTISDYHGYDPEIGGDNLNRGVDYLSYPNPRSVIFGLKMGF
ncbi:MAG: hypothetical protein ACRC2O_04915, partial [Chitinophagaceae bacterium]